MGVINVKSQTRSTGFLRSSEEVLLYIEFDEDGFAIECREGYRAGG